MSDENEFYASAKLTSKGQITIPKIVRDKMELEEGDRILFFLEDKDVKIINQKNCKVMIDENKQQIVVKRGKKNE